MGMGQAGMGSGIGMGLASTVGRRGIFGQDMVLLVKLEALMALMQSPGSIGRGAGSRSITRSTGSRAVRTQN
jgi:hypothetical protein